MGLVSGLAMAWLLVRTLMSLVPLARADWITFAGRRAWARHPRHVACYVPARRATSVPAMTACGTNESQSLILIPIPNPCGLAVLTPPPEIVAS